MKIIKCCGVMEKMVYDYIVGKKREADNAVVLVKRNDFFTCIGEDAMILHEVSGGSVICEVLRIRGVPYLINGKEQNILVSGFSAAKNQCQVFMDACLFAGIRVKMYSMPDVLDKVCLN